VHADRAAKLEASVVAEACPVVLPQPRDLNGKEGVEQRENGEVDSR